MNEKAKQSILDTLGVNLKKYRNERGLSVRKLADLADIDFSQVHRIEKGQSNPTVNTLIALSEALGVTVIDLLIE